MRKAQYLFIILLAFLILFNFRKTVDIIVKDHKVSRGAEVFPGSPFLFLKPFLVHVYRVGYYSDDTPADPDLDSQYAYHFQTAQFALAPAILDHKKPWDHDYVIVFVAHPRVKTSIRLGWPAREIVSNGFNIALIRRIKS